MKPESPERPDLDQETLEQIVALPQEALELLRDRLTPTELVKILAIISTEVNKITDRVEKNKKRLSTCNKVQAFLQPILFILLIAVITGWIADWLKA